MERAASARNKPVEMLPWWAQGPCRRAREPRNYQSILHETRGLGRVWGTKESQGWGGLGTPTRDSTAPILLPPALIQEEAMTGIQRRVHLTCEHLVHRISV